MTKPTFTPGPWIIDPDETLPLAVIVDDENGTGIAEISVKPRREASAEVVANANLIAAAPELYAALDAIVGRIWEHDERTEFYKAEDRGRATLAKARGE